MIKASRYAKKVRRLGGDLTRSAGYVWAAAHRPLEIVPAFWLPGQHNFGDDLTEHVLVPFGLAPAAVPQAEARLIGVGSLLNWVPSDYTGFILGTGLIEPEEGKSFPHATVLAVRGHLTREMLGVPAEGTVVGDPGLLAGVLAERGQPGPIGIVPHVSQLHEPFVRTLVRRIGSERCVVVDARRRPGRVIEEIGRCSAVVSTSLHGLIVADALGIPAAWATADPPLIGGDFKFRDHESVVSARRGRRVDLADLRDERSVRRAAHPADAAAVARAQEGLVRVLDAVRRDAASGPAGVARHELRRLILDRVTRRLP